MYDNLGFDPKTLSAEDLFNTQPERVKPKAQAARLGPHDIIVQLNTLIVAIENERHERIFLDRYASLPSSPVLIETDPGMREEEKIEQEIKAKPTEIPRSIRRPVRTAKPVIPTDGA